jgi:hypothetical protein
MSHEGFNTINTLHISHTAPATRPLSELHPPPPRLVWSQLHSRRTMLLSLLFLLQTAVADSHTSAWPRWRWWRFDVRAFSAFSLWGLSMDDEVERGAQATAGAVAVQATAGAVAAQATAGAVAAQATAGAVAAQATAGAVAAQATAGVVAAQATRARRNGIRI